MLKLPAFRRKWEKWLRDRKELRLFPNIKEGVCLKKLMQGSEQSRIPSWTQLNQRNSSWLLRSTRGLLYFCARIRTESFHFCVYVPMHCIHTSQNIQLWLTSLLFSCYSNLNCLNDNETDEPWPGASSCPVVWYCESSLTSRVRCCTLFIIFTGHRLYIYYIFYWTVNNEHVCLGKNKVWCCVYVHARACVWMLCVSACMYMCACVHTSETVPCIASFRDVFLLLLNILQYSHLLRYFNEHKKLFILPKVWFVNVFLKPTLWTFLKNVYLYNLSHVIVKHYSFVVNFSLLQIKRISIF